jgi:hypothetical protein
LNIAIGHLLARHAPPELLTIYPIFPIQTFGGRVFHDIPLKKKQKNSISS